MSMFSRDSTTPSQASMQGISMSMSSSSPCFFSFLPSLSSPPSLARTILLRDLTIIGAEFMECSLSIPSSSRHSRQPSDGASRPSHGTAHGLVSTKQSRASASVAHSSSSPMSVISWQPIGSQQFKQPSQQGSSSFSMSQAHSSTQVFSTHHMQASMSMFSRDSTTPSQASM